MTKLLIGARLMPIVLIVAVLLGLYIAQFHLSPVRASVPSCGYVQVSGSSWAGGNGVDVHSNGVDDGTPTSCGSYVTNLSANPPQWGYGWQCVELAARMYRTHGWNFPSGNAAQLYTNAKSAGLSTMAQGSIVLAKVVPGDLLVTHEKVYGHVMLVDSINFNANKISAVDQNGLDGGRTTVTFSNGYLSDGSYYQFSGVVHSPSNTLVNPSQDPTPPPVPWNFENLEGGANAVSPYVGNVGKTPSSLVFNGQIYVFYYTVTGHNLRVAYTTPGWVFDTVDGLGGGSGKISADVGQVPDAVVFNNTLYVFYYDNSNGNLRMAWSTDGRTWQALTMDGDPGSLSGYNANVGQTPYAVVYNGSLQLFYYQPDIGVLRHAWSGDGAHWSFETLDGTSGSNSHFVGNVGLDVSATVYSGTLQLFYSNIGQGDLRHAWSDANGWHFENLDGDAGSIGHSKDNVGGDPSAYVYNGSLGVLYYDSTQGSLRHAWSDANGWHFEVLMGGSGSILGGVKPVGSSITTLVNGTTLQAFVYQAQFGDLDHVWNDGNGWHEENLDGAGGSPAGRINANVGLDPTEIMNGTSVVVFYYDADNGALRHAWSN